MFFFCAAEDHFRLMHMEAVSSAMQYDMYSSGVKAKCLRLGSINIKWMHIVTGKAMKLHFYVRSLV